MDRTVLWLTTVVALGLAACRSPAGGPKNAGTLAKSPGPVKEGDPCQRGGPGTPVDILDQHGQPVDFKSEASVMAATGQWVLICAPVRHPQSGWVIDRATRAPIAGAKVTVESWHTAPPIGGGLTPDRDLQATIEAVTDADGRWSVPGAGAWMQGVLAADGFPFFIDSVCVHAPGHAPFVHDPWKGDGRQRLDLAEIALAPGTPPPPSPGSTSRCGLELGHPLR